MASHPSVFDSVGRATSTPRIESSSTQGARAKLLSVRRQSPPSVVNELESMEGQNIHVQISDMERALNELTSDYQRCRDELRKTIRHHRQRLAGESLGVSEVRETESPPVGMREQGSISPTTVNLAMSERGEDRLQANMSTTPVHNPQTHRLRKQKEPDKFDGKSVAWQDYLVHFEQVSVWNGWSYAEQSQQLIMSLRGEAQKILGDLSQGQLRDYDALKSILGSRFSPKELIVAHRVEFRSRLRKADESPSDYGYALRRMGNLAFPDMSYADREIVILEQFMNGVGNIDIRSHVILHHPKTLENAISSATEFEAVKGQQLSITKPGSVHAVQSSQVKSPDELLSALKSLQISLNKLANTQRGGKRQTGKAIECYNCHEMGHIAKYCKAPKTNTPDKNNQSNLKSASTQSENAQEN